MLIKNEPYRYATPARTQTKLAALRIAATGVRRRGSTKGAKRSPNYGLGGTKAVKALATVYAEEGLPALAQPTSAEDRVLRASGAGEFADSLKSERRVRRKSPTASAKSEK